jgi:molybdopterin synthase catalytic subunit
MIRIAVQHEDFDAGAEIAAAGEGGMGAVSVFIGRVRGDDKGDGSGGVTALTLEHYPGMTERALDALAQQAVQRWPVGAVTIIHRVGTLRPGDQIVLVVTASAHRVDALESTAFLIDKLKTQAPFWKKETGAGGNSIWVDARESDDAAAALWD